MIGAARPDPARTDPRIARLVSWLAAATALSFALLVPAAYFITGDVRIQARLDAQAAIGATAISDLAMRNPDLWTFENARIRGMLAQLIGEEASRIRVFAVNGQKVAELGAAQPKPILTARRTVYDSGMAVGMLEVAESGRPLAVSTAAVALFALLAAACVFAVLRLLPLRLLDRALSRAAFLATHDALTGLPNRALFRDRLDQALARLHRAGGMVAVLYIDLDRFKAVNDTLGHGAGDQLLRQVAMRLSANLRETDTLARLGGDEFAVIQLGDRHPADVEALAGRFIAALAEPFDLDGHHVSIGGSIGVAVRHQPGGAEARASELGAMLQEADLALYQAKAEGRGAYRFFEAAMNRHLLERRKLEADLREAIATGQFRLSYQPQFDLIDHHIFGAEALIRWLHPQRGEMRPDEFIPLAEETGLIVQIGEWALREACREAATWPQPLRIAVNVSPVQFRRPGFVETVRAALAETGLERGRLELEVTEGVLLSDTEETLDILGRLRALGASIAMDDFGTGYSSLGYLQKFPFDKIKIDRSFVRGLGKDPHALAIVSAVLGMARALGMRVNAEGVEMESQARILLAEGCDEVQGFLFSQPVPPESLRAMMATEATSQEASAVD